MADRAIDMIRDRFGREAIGYGSVTLEGFRSVPDEFRELAKRTSNPGIDPQVFGTKQITHWCRQAFHPPLLSPPAVSLRPTGRAHALHTPSPALSAVAPRAGPGA